MFERRRRFRLRLPSFRTFMVMLLVLAFGFLVSMVYMVLIHHERAFWDMLIFTVFLAIIAFISVYVVELMGYE